MTTAAGPTDIGGDPTDVASDETPEEPDTATPSGPSSGRRHKPNATGSWHILRPLLAGETPRLIGLSVSSFLGGIAEATLLVVVANLALAIGGDTSTLKSTGLLDWLGDSVETMFFVALLLTAIRLILQYIAAQQTATTAARLTQKIREGTFDDYVHASWGIQAAEAEASIQDLLLRHVGKAQAAVVTIATSISTAFMLVALVGSAFLVDPVAAILVIVGGVLLAVMLRPLTLYAKRLAKKQLELGLVYVVASREAVDFSLEIRSFGVSGEVSERLRVATEKEIEPSTKALMVSRMVGGVYSLAAVLIILAGLFAVYNLQDRPLGSLGAIVIILIRALNQSQALQSSYHSLSESVPFVQRLDAERARFRASRPPSGDVMLDNPRGLRFESVSYSYNAERDALFDISFEVEAGEAIGLIGPSGSGKSTLIQLLLRLRQPTRGRYLVGDTDASDVNDESWFHKVAFVPQDCRVFDASIADNIRFYRPGITDEQIIEAAHRAHVHDEIMAMPHGYATELGSRGGALSGGQRQRVAIARALVLRPSILVLDEPTSALDMRSESLVHETLSKIKGSVTLFVIAHRLSTLNTCDRIMVMGDGRLQAFGSREVLDRESEFYRRSIQLSQIRS